MMDKGIYMIIEKEDPNSQKLYLALIVIVILAIKLSNPSSSSQADMEERTSSLRTKHMINPFIHLRDY